MRRALMALLVAGCTAPNPDFDPAVAACSQYGICPEPPLSDMALSFEDVDAAQLEDASPRQQDLAQPHVEDMARPADLSRSPDLKCPWLYASQCTYQDAGGPPVFCVMAIGRRAAPDGECELPPPQLFSYCNGACDLCPDGGIAVTNRYKGQPAQCEPPK